jgi:aerobic-type carbon monoxide dehydrogenase small subunit (CoxS/CutS family)
MALTHTISFTVNGEASTLAVPARQNVADLLRETLGLTGTKLGCEHGVCGTCTVLLDGAPVRSCIMLAAQVDGHDITTVEGLSDSSGNLSVLQQAFCDAHGLQCGYCTSGMLMCAQALLKQNPSPDDEDIDEAIGGNICRCTGYEPIRQAITLAAERLADDRSAASAAATAAIGA